MGERSSGYRHVPYPVTRGTVSTVVVMGCFMFIGLVRYERDCTTTEV